MKLKFIIVYHCFRWYITFPTQIWFIIMFIIILDNHILGEINNFQCINNMCCTYFIHHINYCHIGNKLWYKDVNLKWKGWLSNWNFITLYYNRVLQFINHCKQIWVLLFFEQLLYKIPKSKYKIVLKKFYHRSSWLIALKKFFLMHLTIFMTHFQQQH